MPLLELSEIRATSPTLAEIMRACPLRAGLSRASGCSNFVLGNPKAWLGTAYHEVLEKIVEINLGLESLANAVDRLWSLAIAAQQHRNELHALDRRFGSPPSWPGYHIARASVLLRAREIVGGRPPAAAPNTKDSSGAGPAETIREERFTAFGGKLLGRPDVIRANEVVDYKSGTIFEYDAATQTDAVKAAYVRQLRIYGYLVKERLGWWPERGILFPLGGAGVEIALDPSDCIREATEAVALLDSYNKEVRTGVVPEKIAVPSPQSCRWCPHKLLCPAFWRATSPDWSGQLDGAAVEGLVTTEPSVIHAGAARAVSLEIQAGSEIRQRAQIAPLNVATYPIVTTLSSGDLVRFVGLRARPDGVLLPGNRTVAYRVDDLPRVTTACSPA